VKARLVLLAVVVGIAGWLASAAAACHSEINASMDCSGSIEWTATAWNGSDATDQSRSNSDVRVYASLDGGRSWTQIGSGQFSKGNHFSFSGRWSAGSTASAMVKVQEVGRWGNGDAPAPARTVTAARPSSCGSSGGTQCTGRSMVSAASQIGVSGSNAGVTFTVTQGCGVELSLVSYKTPQMEYYRSTTQTVGPGTYTWSIPVPSCTYQVDFVYGKPITSGAVQYGNALIRTTNGGPSCTTTPASPSSGSGSMGSVAPSAPAAVAPPTISLVKLERVGSSGSFVAGPVAAQAGETVSYLLTVRNAGTTTVSVNLRDDGCDVGTLSPAGPQALAAGASLTFSCSHRIVAADGARFVNTAVATANNASPQPVSVSASVTANVGVSGVKAANKTFHKQKVKNVKKVKKVAKPARAVVRAADFTG
jgi:hypothetical protein